MDRNASVLDLTNACLSKFDQVMASRSSGGIENRFADFSLWVDSVGAAAKSGLSLDSRFRSRPNDLALVKSVLLMLLDSLEYYATLSQTGKEPDHGVQNVDSAIRNLALIGVAIRRTGKASRSRRADKTFDPDKHRELRKHLECLLLCRPTKDGRPQNELDPSRLSDIQRRLIDANLRRRHQFLLAQKFSRGNKFAPDLPAGIPPRQESSPAAAPDLKGSQALDPKASQSHPSRAATRERMPGEAPTISAFSRASTAEGTLNYAAAKRYTPGVARSQLTQIASATEFPEPPSIPVDREIFKCPCCCQSLQVETFKHPTLWKQHLIEDLCPYTCIAKNCPTPQLLFSSRKEWEAHVQKSHLPQWQCPFCQDDNTEQPSMEAMGLHLQTNHKYELADESLSTLLSWSAVQRMGITDCPFCPSKGPEDEPDLVDHILEEAYDFSLRALPWPKPEIHNLTGKPGVWKLPQKDLETPFDRWIREPDVESAENIELKLCDYDNADHSEPRPADLGEYTDYFDEGGYFGEKLEDESLMRQRDRGSAAQSSRSFDTESASPFIKIRSSPSAATILQEGEIGWRNVQQPEADIPNERFRPVPMAALEKTIQFGRDTVNTTPSGHPQRSKFLNNLGFLLRIKYLQTGEIADLKEAIWLFRDAIADTTLDFPDGSRDSIRMLSNLWDLPGPIIPDIASLLKDPDQQVVMATVKALGQRPDLPEAILKDTMALLKNPGEWVKYYGNA